jgi:hypothetical protein
MFPEFPVVPASPLLPLHPTLETPLSLSCQHRRNTVLYIECSAVTAGHQPKRSQHFWVQLSESRPTKINFIEDKLPDGIISLEKVKALRHDKNPVSVSTPPVIF